MTMYKSLRLVSFVNNTPLFYTTHFASTRVRKQRAKKKEKMRHVRNLFLWNSLAPFPFVSLHTVHCSLSSLGLTYSYLYCYSCLAILFLPNSGEQPNIINFTTIYRNKNKNKKNDDDQLSATCCTSIVVYSLTFYYSLIE